MRRVVWNVVDYIRVRHEIMFPEYTRDGCSKMIGKLKYQDVGGIERFHNLNLNFRSCHEGTEVNLPTFTVY